MRGEMVGAEGGSGTLRAALDTFGATLDVSAGSRAGDGQSAGGRCPVTPQ
jgi:hypothetical protein